MSQGVIGYGDPTANPVGRLPLPPSVCSLLNTFCPPARHFCQTREAVKGHIVQLTHLEAGIEGRVKLALSSSLSVPVPVPIVQQHTLTHFFSFFFFFNVSLFLRDRAGVGRGRERRRHRI